MLLDDTRPIQQNTKNPTALQYVGGVAELSLRNNRLAGTLPAWLFALPCLVLDVSRNRLTGRLPAWAGHNPLIREMTVEFNDLTGPLPDSFDT